jgi:predicted XRE-type DNA-binding protein
MEPVTMIEKIQVEESSGNVFADIGLPLPEQRLGKADLAFRISELIRARGLTQPAAARLLGIDQPKISRLIRGQLAGFSTERLMQLLTLLGQEVEIVVRPAITHKQMADACEMLVAAELTLAGVPSLKVPDNWPGYDVIAQPGDREPQRVSVKHVTFRRGGDRFVRYLDGDSFDWLAVVLLPGDTETRRRFFLVPRSVADEKARRDKPTSKTAKERYWRVDEVPRIFAAFEDNFSLDPSSAEDKRRPYLSETGDASARIPSGT